MISAELRHEIIRAEFGSDADEIRAGYEYDIVINRSNRLGREMAIAVPFYSGGDPASVTEDYFRSVARNSAEAFRNGLRSL